ncbi:MAG: hypothetical protein L6R38_009712, partial [Xanthoria sp. 2 TBL-2021]
TATLLPVAESISQLKWLWYRHANSLGDLPAYADASTSPFATIFLVLRRRGAPLVYLAAISSWLVLLFGPFAQQALQQPLREVYAGTGSIPNARTYQASSSTRIRYTGLTDSGGQNTFSITSPPDPVREAITNGLFDSHVSLSAVPGTCRTGNCTWDPFKSLRVYASIEDVTNTLMTNCPNNTRKKERGCLYSVPEIEEHPTWLQSHMQSANQSIWLGASNPSGDYTFPGLNTLLQFYVIYLPDLQTLNNSAQNYTTSLRALKGTLDLGLSTLNTSMLFGATTTTEITLITDLKWRTSQTTINGTKHDIISTTPRDGSDEFWMGLSSRTYFNQLLSEAIFLGHGDFNQSLLPDDIAYSTDAARLVGESLYHNNAGRDGLQTLLDKLAISMTNALRTTTIYPTTANASAWKFEPYFDIAWGWLALPIATIVATFLLLLFTICLSAHHKIPAWKSSHQASLLAPSKE